MSGRITFTLHELVALMDGYADRLLQERYGVGFNHFHFLAVLSDVEPSDMTTLAACLGITKAAVSKRAPALVAGGWITQVAGTGRSVLLSLSPQGAALVRDAGGELEREFGALLTDPALAALDIGRLNRDLSTLIAHITHAQKEHES